MPRLSRGSVVHMQALNELVNFIARAPRSILRPPAFFLRALRGRLCMSQAQLSRRCGVGQSQIAKIERGLVVPELVTLRRLYDALFCDLVVIPKPRQRPSDAVGDLVMGRDPMHKRGLGLWKG